ncbi:MAG: hypothetical protein AB8G15_21910 [Saprospiraceae bacterium]
MRISWWLFGLICLNAACKSPIAQNINYTQATQIQLSTPMIELDSVFFHESARLRLTFDHPEVILHYADAGTVLDQKSRSYVAPLVFKNTKSIQVQAFHPSCKASEVQEIEVVRLNEIARQATIKVTPAPKAPYDQGGIKSLQDFDKASTAFRDEAWLGFQADTITLSLAFPVIQAVRSIGLSFLKDHHSWIFLPERIEVWRDNQQVASLEIPLAKSKQAVALKIKNLNFPSINTNKLELKLIRTTKLPTWHPGSGLSPWIFLDEVLVNI